MTAHDVSPMSRELGACYRTLQRATDDADDERSAAYDAAARELRDVARGGIMAPTRACALDAFADAIADACAERAAAVERARVLQRAEWRAIHERHGVHVPPAVERTQ
jgi:hypothetical protein